MSQDPSTLPVFHYDITAPANSTVYTQCIRNERAHSHRHSYIEFFFVMEGLGKHRLNGETMILQIGDACLLTPEDFHSLDKTEDGPFTRRDILFRTSFFQECCDAIDSDLFQEIMSGAFPRQFKLSAEQMSAIETYSSSLFSNPDSWEYRLSAKAVTLFLLNLMILNKRQVHTSTPIWLSILLTRMNSRDNFHAELDELTADFSYNPDYMRRVFKKYTGLTMTDYFNKQKINLAYTLLQTTDLPLHAICETIDIENESYFYKLFKKTFHTTPKSIRK